MPARGVEWGTAPEREQSMWSGIAAEALSKLVYAVADVQHIYRGMGGRGESPRMSRGT